MTAVERRPAAMNPAFAELIKLLAEAAVEEYLAEISHQPETANTPKSSTSQTKPDGIDSPVQPKANETHISFKDIEQLR